MWIRTWLSHQCGALMAWRTLEWCVRGASRPRSVRVVTVTQARAVACQLLVARATATTEHEKIDVVSNCLTCFSEPLQRRLLRQSALLFAGACLSPGGDNLSF